MKPKNLQVIYQPAGKAQEYAESTPGAGDGYALNIYRGCCHKCAYCYVPTIPPWRFSPKTAKADFHKEVLPRQNLLTKLEHDLKILEGMENPLHLCFTCDPYPPENNELTRRVLMMCEYYKLKNVQILTKGGWRATRDFDLLLDNEWKFGSTIIFTDDLHSVCDDNHGLEHDGWEPDAACYQDRAGSIQLAYEQGIETWVSVEPVIYPDQALDVIERLNPFVHTWKIGKLNHGKDISPQCGEIEAQTDWKKFLHDIRLILDGYNYIIKKSLLAYE